MTVAIEASRHTHRGRPSWQDGVCRHAGCGALEPAHLPVIAPRPPREEAPRCGRCTGLLITKRLLGGEYETSCFNCGSIEGSGREPTYEERTGYEESTDRAGKHVRRRRNPSTGVGGARVKM